MQPRTIIVVNLAWRWRQLWGTSQFEPNPEM